MLQVKLPTVEMIYKRKGALLTLRLFPLSVSSPRLAKWNRHWSFPSAVNNLCPSDWHQDFVLYWPKLQTLYIFKTPFPSCPWVNVHIWIASLCMPTIYKLSDLNKYRARILIRGSCLFPDFSHHLFFILHPLFCWPRENFRLRAYNIKLFILTEHGFSYMEIR